MKSYLKKKYRPSEPCTCNTCKSYCIRPGWWTVEEAKRIIAAGKADRMMLEISPERDFGVLTPAYKGNKSNYTLQFFAGNGYTFLQNGLCELFGTDLQPLECRYCHHSRKGLGIECHWDIEKDWRSRKGKELVAKWGKMVFTDANNRIF